MKKTKVQRFYSEINDLIPESLRINFTGAGFNKERYNRAKDLGFCEDLCHYFASSDIVDVVDIIKNEVGKCFFCGKEWSFGETIPSIRAIPSMEKQKNWDGHD